MRLVIPSLPSWATFVRAAGSQPFEEANHAWAPQGNYLNLGLAYFKINRLPHAVITFEHFPNQLKFAFADLEPSGKQP